MTDIEKIKMAHTVAGVDNQAIGIVSVYGTHIPELDLKQ